MYELAGGQVTCLETGNTERIRDKGEGSQRAQKASQTFARLRSAGQRLLAVIEHNRGGANKDLARFADQITALCDKWER